MSSRERVPMSRFEETLLHSAMEYAERDVNLDGIGGFEVGLRGTAVLRAVLDWMAIRHDKTFDETRQTTRTVESKESAS